MNAIAAEAGITKPILYRHFGDKGGLYAALAKRHTDALLDSLRAALDAPAERRERVEATLDTYLSAIEARPQVYRFLMHPGDSVSPGDPGFDVRKHSLPLLRLMGEELAQVIEERLDLGPGSQQLARVWGHGIVGMMHAAGDWWLGNSLAPGRSWCGVWLICCGGDWLPPGIAWGSGVLRVVVVCGPVGACRAVPRAPKDRPVNVPRTRKLGLPAASASCGASLLRGPRRSGPPGGRTRVGGSGRRSLCPRSAPGRPSS